MRIICWLSSIFFFVYRCTFFQLNCYNTNVLNKLEFGFLVQWHNLLFMKLNMYDYSLLVANKKIKKRLGMIRINKQFSLSGRLRINSRCVFMSFNSAISVRYNIMDWKTYKSCTNVFNMNKSF